MQMLALLSGNIIISLSGRCLNFGKLTDKVAGISSIDLSLLMGNTSFTLLQVRWAVSALAFSGGFWWYTRIKWYGL